MQVDESYAAYVATRWSTLYRLAALLAGEDRADDLAQEALVRAYLVWPHRSADGPPEDDVKAVLARLAVEAAPEPVAGAGLAARVASLPQRPRVLLVLRCFEYLADADVARILGAGREAVQTETAAALEQVGAAEAEVTTALLGRADALVVPFPPVEPLLSRAHEARRRRRRRTLRLTGVAIAVMVVGLGVGSYLQAHPIRWSSPPRIPATLAGLGTGPAARVPYATNDTLHLPGDKYYVLDAEPTAIAPAGRWTYVSTRSGTIVRIDGDTLHPVSFTGATAGPVVADPRGRYVAWVDVSNGSPRVVVADPRSTATLRERAVPDCCDGPPQVDGITTTGDVVVSFPASSRAWLWQAPGTYPALRGDLQEIEGIGNGVVHQVTGDGHLVVYRYPNAFVAGPLDSNGLIADEEYGGVAADFADPRGQRVVYATDTGRILVGRRGAADDTHDLRLALPPLTGGFRGLHWEDEDHVLLDVTDGSMPRGALVRCDVGSGACERVVRFDGPHLLAR